MLPYETRLDVFYCLVSLQCFSFVLHSGSLYCILNSLQYKTNMIFPVIQDKYSLFQLLWCRNSKQNSEQEHLEQSLDQIPKLLQKFDLCILNLPVSLVFQTARIPGLHEGETIHLNSTDPLGNERSL